MSGEGDLALRGAGAGLDPVNAPSWPYAAWASRPRGRFAWFPATRREPRYYESERLHLNDRHRFRQGRHRHRRRARHRPRGIALLMAQEGARVVVCDIGASLEGAGADAGPAQEVVDEIKRPAARRSPRRSRSSSRRTPTRSSRPRSIAFGRVDILVNNAGILRDRIFHKMSWSDWSDVIAVHLNGSFNMSRAVAGAFPRAEFRRLRAHDLDLRPDRQFRPGQLHGGQARHRRPVARHRARHAALQGALELHRAVRLDAHDRLDPGRNRGREEARRAVAADDAGKIAPLVVYLGSDAAEGISGQIFRCATTRFSVQPDPPDPHHPPLRRLDAGKLDAQLKGAFGPSFTPLDRSSDVFSWDPI